MHHQQQVCEQDAARSVSFCECQCPRRLDCQVVRWSPRWRGCTKPARQVEEAQVGGHGRGEDIEGEQRTPKLAGEHMVGKRRTLAVEKPSHGDHCQWGRVPLARAPLELSTPGHRLTHRPLGMSRQRTLSTDFHRLSNGNGTETEDRSSLARFTVEL